MAFSFNPFTGNFDDVKDVAEKVTGPASSTDNAIVRYDGTTGKLVQNSSVTISDTGDLTVSGDLTVNGTTTTLNTATLDVEDKNINVNVSGNDASAEGAGLTVTRTGTDGSLVYEDALASKWKIGALGSEIEIADISSTQTLTNKTLNASNNTITNITNTSIDAAAAIQLSKLASLTIDRAVISNGSGVLTVSATTSTELGYVSGVTSAIQTQLNAKLDDFGASSDHALLRTNGTTGEAVQASGVILDDSDFMTGLASLTFTTGVAVTSTIDEDDFSSDSATALATQQSIKAYVDNKAVAGIYDIASISTNTAAVNGITYLVDTSGGTVSVTLPDPAPSTYIRVKDSTGTADTNAITVLPNAAETIDGAASHVISSEYGSNIYVSNGTNWFVL